jgi:hypothetical protein
MNLWKKYIFMEMKKTYDPWNKKIYTWKKVVKLIEKKICAHQIDNMSDEQRTKEFTHKIKEEVHFWPLNYSQSLVLTFERQNQKSLAIELLKPFTFGHPVVLQGGFADVAATWWWAHMSDPLLSSPSPLSPLYPLSSNYRRPSRTSGSPVAPALPGDGGA